MSSPARSASPGTPSSATRASPSNASPPGTCAAGPPRDVAHFLPMTGQSLASATHCPVWYGHASLVPPRYASWTVSEPGSHRSAARSGSHALWSSLQRTGHALSGGRNPVAGRANGRWTSGRSPGREPPRRAAGARSGFFHLRSTTDHANPEFWIPAISGGPVS
jgi:hypothetical protein